MISEALRWQLQRILEDQGGSQAPAGEHATMNSLYAEAWRFLSRHGIAAKWTLDEYNRLVDSGWSPASAKSIGDLVFNLQTGVPVSHVQMDAYVNTFGIAATDGNLDKMRRTVCAANAAACREATANLSLDADVAADWIDDALMDDAPFAWETPSAPAEPSPHLCQWRPMRQNQHIRLQALIRSSRRSFCLMPPRSASPPISGRKRGARIR